MGDVKYRIRATGQPNLPGQRFHPFFLRHERDVHFRQRLGRLPFLLTARPIEPSAFLAPRSRTLVAPRARSAPACFIAFAPLRPLAAPLGPARARLGSAAFVFGVAIDVRGLLGPGGQELQLQVFQIQTGVRRIAHAITSRARPRRLEQNGGQE